MVEVEPSATTVLTDLPNEVLEKIMDFVSFDDLFILEIVNLQLRDVVLNIAWPKRDTINHETLTKYTDYPHIRVDNDSDREIEPYSFNDKFLKAIFSRTNIQHLDLSDYHKKINFQICPLLSKTPQLLTLNLSKIKLNEKDLLKIAQYCPLLEELSLKCSFENGDRDYGLQQIFIKCPNIKYLDLEENSEINGSSFTNIPTQLKFLNILNCYDLTIQALNNLVIRAQNLETLIWSNFFYAGNPMNLLSQFKKLKFLEFQDMKETFMDFSSLIGLEMLSLKLYQSVNVESLQTLQNCPKLKSLEINFLCCKMIDVYEILKNCISLEYLNLNIVGKTNLNQLCDLIQNCKLKYLSLSNCKYISGKTIKTLLTKCDSLTHLEFNAACRLNFTAIEKILKEENSKRKNILKFAIFDPPANLLSCKWCKIIENGVSKGLRFNHFTDVKFQYHKHKSLC